MRSKVIPGICSLLILGVIVVSANRPELVVNLVGSINQSITAGLFTDVQSETARAALPEDANSRRLAARRPESKRAERPEPMLWHMAFDFARKMETRAAEANSRGEKGDIFDKYFTRQGPLSADEDVILKRFAVQYLTDIGPLEQTAKAIADAAKGALGNPKDIRLTPEQFGELKELQKRKDETALKYRDLLKTAFGDEAFDRFLLFLKTDFTKGSITNEVLPDSATPSGFYYEGISRIIWDEGEDPPYITGDAELYFVYFFPEGFYYDPVIEGWFVNASTQSVLSHQIDVGYRDIFPALVLHPIFVSNRGQTYCTLSDFWAVLFDGPFPYDEIFLDYADVCHLVGPPAPTPTPTPTPPTPTPTPTPTPCEPFGVLPCQTPTPTPEPTPTPTPPTLQVTEVGFKGDHKITRLATDVVIDPNDNEPTWVRNRPNNDDFPVAYTKGTSPTVFAKFNVTPAPTQPITAHIRARKGNVTLTPANNVEITISSSMATVDDVPIAFSGLEDEVTLKHEDYEFDWQISFNNGQTWANAGQSGDHEIHWLWAAPIQPTFMNIVGYENRDNPSTVGKYFGLYDEALKNSTGKIGRGQGNVDKVVEKISSILAQKINYRPNRPFTQENPLKMLLESPPTAQCTDNAFILYGLMRSVGIQPTVVYHWGGDTRPGPSYGSRHFYTYPHAPGSSERITLQVSRPQLGHLPCNATSECVEQNPHFTYHATVLITYTENGQQKTVSFDPSYGVRENEVKLIEAVNESGVLLRNNAANAYKFSRDRYTPEVNVNFATSCSHFANFAVNPIFPQGNFDDEPRSDFAVVRPSTGGWLSRSSAPTDAVSVIDPHFDSYSAIVPGDYDGDYITDAAVRNADYPNLWQIRDSSTGNTRTVLIEPTYVGETPVVGDWDGDGKDDIATFRSSDGVWMVHRSSDEVDSVFWWGMNGDIPVPSDYDGDSKTDHAVWRPSDGVWYIYASSTNAWITAHWGMDGDVPVVGDYNGDGRADFAVVRPNDGVWYVLDIADATITYYYNQLLTTDYKLVPGDYDGDGRTDSAVWRASDGLWIVVQSRDGTTRVEQWGSGGKSDIPVQAAYIHW